MDFSRRKLRLAAWVLVVGMLLSLLYHGWEGWILGKGYPSNTFLSVARNSYTDFTESWQPKKAFYGFYPYFPVCWLFFASLARVPAYLAEVVFMDVSLTALFILAVVALRETGDGLPRRAVIATFFLFSYPVLFDFDRGNIETILVFFVGLFLYLYSRKRFAWSFWALLPAICLKLYPAVLLLLFFRRRFYPWIFFGAALFGLLSFGALFFFKRPILESCVLLYAQIDGFNRKYDLTTDGVAASSSAFNAGKALIVLACSALHSHATIGMFRAALRLYSGLTLAGLAGLTFYLLVIETTFPRRAILLLLDMTTSAPPGADYKLMHVGTALLILILIRERRRFDLAVTALLAFCLLPKREAFLHFMGKSDTHFYDAPIGIILTPLSLLAAMGLLLASGWIAARPVDFRARLRKVVSWICCANFSRAARDLFRLSD